jgi:hypothetical protein
MAICRGFRSISFMLRLFDCIFRDINGFSSVFLFMIAPFCLTGNFIIIYIYIYKYREGISNDDHLLIFLFIICKAYLLQDPKFSIQPFEVL